MVSDFMSITVVTVLAYSIVGKVRSFSLFRSNSAELIPFIPQKLVGVFSLVVVLVEFLALVLVVLRNSIGLTVSAVLFLIFALVALVAQRSPKPIRCNCFGAESSPISVIHWARAILVAAGCVAANLIEVQGNREQFLLSVSFGFLAGWLFIESDKFAETLKPALQWRQSSLRGIEGGVRSR